MLGEGDKMIKKNLVNFFKQGLSKLKKGYSQDQVKQTVRLGYIYDYIYEFAI